jgi:hypothetical protein
LGSNKCFDISIDELQSQQFVESFEISIVGSTYWHALPGNFACVDGFVTGLNLSEVSGFEKSSIFGVQYTMNKKHGIKHEPLKKHMKDFAFVDEDNKWTVDDTFNVCFVVPPNIFMSMPVQNYVDTKGNSMELVSYLKGHIRQFAIMITFENLVSEAEEK